jgi:hypothetical protein
MMLDDLKGKRTLVTGSSTGIEIVAKGGMAVVVIGDIGRPGVPRRPVEEASARRPHHRRAGQGPSRRPSRPPRVWRG